MDNVSNFGSDSMINFAYDRFCIRNRNEERFIHDKHDSGFFYGWHFHFDWSVALMSIVKLNSMCTPIDRVSQTSISQHITANWDIAVCAHFWYLHMAQVDLPIQQAYNLYIVYIKYCISIQPVSINGAINVSHNTLQAKVMHVITSHRITSQHLTLNLWISCFICIMTIPEKKNIKYNRFRE